MPCMAAGPRRLKLSARCAERRESETAEWIGNPMFYSSEERECS